MAAKKKINDKDAFVDILSLLRNWWYFKKLVIFGTLIITLLSLFIIILTNNTPKKSYKSEYVSAVVQGDLLDNNDRIIAGLTSPEIVKKTLETLGLGTSSYEAIQGLVVQKATNPLTENLQDRIANLEISDIKKLAIAQEDLTSLVTELKNVSEMLISIKFHHKSMNLTNLQAKNFIKTLVRDVNKNILVNSARQDLGLKIIDTSSYSLRSNESEQLSRLFHISNGVRDNILELNKYSNILIRTDLAKITNLAEITQRILFQLSTKMGNTNSIDTLKLNVEEIDRNLKDISETLDYIDNRKYQTSEIKNSFSGSEPKIQIDDKLFDTILSIGNTVSLSEYVQEILIKKNILQQKKNNILTQISSIQLNYDYDLKDLTIESAEKRIVEVANEVNGAILQLRSIINPKQAVEFVQNPEIVLIDTSKKFLNGIIKVVLTLSIISFLCLSFITFLLNPKSSRKT